MTQHPALLAALTLLAAVGAGCASTRPDFYRLSPLATPSATAASYAVSVGPVTVPGDVDRAQIVVRTGPNQVAIDELNLWASPLQSEIPRVVALNLAAALGTPNATVFPQATASGARYRVLVEVQRFDSAPGEAATLDAAWAVRRPEDGQSLSGRTTVDEATQGGGYAALVAAHSRALEKLSSDVAEAIRRLERRAP